MHLLIKLFKTLKKFLEFNLLTVDYYTNVKEYTIIDHLESRFFALIGL